MICTEADADMLKDAQPKQIANAGTGVWPIPLAPLAVEILRAALALLRPSEGLSLGTLTQKFMRVTRWAAEGVALVTSQMASLR